MAQSAIPDLGRISPPMDPRGTFSKLDDAFRAINSGIPVEDEELDRLAQECQGSEESEFCFGEESSLLDRYFNKCPKNPGHKDFILLKDLRLDHLPEGHRRPEFLDLIHCQAALTVRLTTIFGPKKPDVFPLTVKPFRSNATGFVLSAEPMPSRSSDQQDACSSHPESSPGDHLGRQVYRLEILTATHAVFSQAKAMTVQVEFSYFDDSHALRKVKSTADPFYHSDFGEDFSTLLHYIEDEELYLKLQKCLHQIHDEFLIVSPPPEYVPIVSHPHGAEKHVTFGELRREDRHVQMGQVAGRVFPWLDDFSPLWYTTPTCPGSSGARVFLWSQQQRLLIFAHKGKRNEVYNGSARGYRYDDILQQSKTGLRPIIKPPFGH